MRRVNVCAAAALAFGMTACATGGGRASSEVTAVVQDEQSRQAAAATVQQGEDPEAALKAGADAASKDQVEIKPPT